VENINLRWKRGKRKGNRLRASNRLYRGEKGGGKKGGKKVDGFLSSTTPSRKERERKDKTLHLHPFSHAYPTKGKEGKEKALCCIVIMIGTRGRGSGLFDCWSWGLGGRRERSSAHGIL